MKVDKEATLTEVMREVSLADLGSQLKTISLSLGCFAIIGVVFSLVGATAKTSGVLQNLHVPTVVWIAIVVGLYVSMATSERSYHEWSGWFWFPRLRFVGWFAVTAYLTAIIEGFRHVDIFPVGVERGAAVFAVIVVLVVPGLLFLILCQAGHERLIEKREDALRAKLGEAIS